ncbi:MAG: hypothetical protein CMP91_09955 [Gammaproteobacteria bacterium]|nr:hypothetical protein [Gammaproteobacteria bacterium]
MQYSLRLVSQYWLALSLFLLAAIGILTLTPLDQLPPFPGSDKLHHLIAFAALTFPVAFRQPRYWWLVIFAYLAYSGGIELVQPYLNRYGEWADMLANSVGIASGILLAQLLRYYFPITLKSSEELKK